jgi:hypothetical protein
LPFELYAGVSVGGLVFTNLEIAVLAVLALWFAGLAIERRLPRLPRALMLAALALLAICFASAALAPAWRMPALKFSARQFQAALLALCLADQLAASGWLLARRLGLALIAGAAASAALGLLEISEAPPILALLGGFKEQPTMAGGLLRLSASFAYANIAAMYYEAALPICLAALGMAASRPARWMLSGAALLIYGATLLTYSRAALLTSATAIIVILLGAILFQRRASASESVQPGVAGQAAGRVGRLCLALLALTAGVLMASPTFRVRIAAPDIADWYRADYSAARLARLAPNELRTTSVTIANRGLVTWRSSGLRPVALSYHWLEPRTRRVVRYNGRRTLLSKPVDPGGALLLHADVQAPDKPGDYILAWDMVVEHSGWFSERGNPMAEIMVTVAGRPAASRPAPSPEPANMPQHISVRPAPPPRGLLWAAAVRLWRAHPLLGIGPDVFRHMYGPELGLTIWDDRLHTNSLYLELLAGTGVAGLAAFLLLIALAFGHAARVLMPAIRASTAGSSALGFLNLPKDRPREQEPTIAASSLRGGWPPAERITNAGSDIGIWMALGCTVALSTFLIHGVLDMFLEYSATNLLLWALIGALGSLTAIGGDLHDRPEHI